MDRKTMFGVLIGLLILAFLVWAWTIRSRQYPKEYQGEMPSGPNAPKVMDKPIGVGQPGSVPQPQQPQQQPRTGVGAF